MNQIIYKIYKNKQVLINKSIFKINKVMKVIMSKNNKIVNCQHFPLSISQK
jgi:hypothetical protein